MKKIFISSTFKDMQSERDILHEQILPFINEKLSKYGETVLGIDLRWGISTNQMSEEEAEIKAFSVCFDEIDDSRPYFIAFIGERYGYQVKNEIIEKIIPALKYGKHFKESQESLFESKNSRSITELEIRYGCFLNKIPRSHFLFFFRENLDLTEANDESIERYLDQDNISNLKNLKKTIIEEFSEEACISYSASINEDGSLCISDTDINRIETALFKMLVGNSKVVRNHLDLLREQFDKRAKDKHNFYFGREKKFFDLDVFIDNKHSQIMVVSGESGSGKTTFLTEAYYKHKGGNDIFIYVPIATDNSLDDDFGILSYINHCLYKETRIQSFKYKQEEQSEDHFIDDFSIGIHEFAVKYNGSRKIVLILDAVDRLNVSQSIANLSFLTTVILNKYPIKTIVSTATKIDSMQTILDMSNTSYMFINQVTDEEVLSIVNLKFRAYGKELTEPLKKAILNKKNARKCIYLAALAERLLMINRHDFFAIYEQEKNKTNIDYTEQRLLETIQSFPDDLNEAIVQIMEAGAKIVKNDVSQAFYCLSLSSRGLNAGELSYILGIKNYLSDPKNKGKPLEYTLPKKYLTFDYSDFFIVKRYLASFFEETPDGKIVFSHPLYRDAFIEVAIKDKYLVSATIAFHSANYQFDDSFVSLVSLYQMLKQYDGLIRLLRARFLTLDNATTWDEVESIAFISLAGGASDSLLNVFLKSVLESDFSLGININNISFIEYDENLNDDFVFLANILLSVYGFDNSSFVCPPSFKIFIESLIENHELTPSKTLLFIVMITLFANDKNTKLIKDSLPLLKLIIEKTKYYLRQYAVSAYLKVVEALDIAKLEHDYIVSLLNDETTISEAIEFKNNCDIYRLLMPIDKETSYGPNTILFYASVAGTICRLDKINDFTLKGINLRLYSRLFAFVYDTVLSSYVRFWATYFKCYRIDVDFANVLVDFNEINKKATIAARHSHDIPLLKASLELSKTFVEVYHRSFQNIDTHDETIKHHGEFKNHIEIVNRLSKALYPNQNGLLSKEALMGVMRSFSYLILDDGTLPNLSEFEEIKDAVEKYDDLTVVNAFLFFSFALDVHYILNGENGDLSSITNYLKLLMNNKQINYDLIIFICDTLYHLYSKEESFNVLQLYIQLFQQGYYSNYQYNLQTLNCFTKLYEALKGVEKETLLDALKDSGSARTFTLNFLSSVFLATLADFDLTTNYQKLFLANQVLSDIINNLVRPSEEENGLLHNLANEYYKRDMFSFAIGFANGKKPLEICENVLSNCSLEKQNFYGKYQICCFFEAMLYYENDFENKISIAGMCNHSLKCALKDHPTNHIVISKAIAVHRYAKLLFDKNKIEFDLNDIVLDRWYFLSAGLVVLPRDDKLLFELIDDIKEYVGHGYRKEQIPELLVIFEQASLFFDASDRLTADGYNAAIYVLYHQYVFTYMSRNNMAKSNLFEIYDKIIWYYSSARKQHVKLDEQSNLCLREVLIKAHIYGNFNFENTFKNKKKAKEVVNKLMEKYQPYINVYPEIFFTKK